MQLSFDDLIKEQQIFDYAARLENLRLGEEIILQAPDTDVYIKFDGKSAYSDKTFTYKTVLHRGCCFDLYSLAARLVIGFNYRSYSCKWIRGKSIAWQPLEKIEN